MYVYRVHKFKLDNLSGNGLSGLRDYLDTVFRDCPDDYFNNGGSRGSQLKFKVNVDLKSVGEHEVNALTRYGLMVNGDRYKSNHSKVQVFMLEHDKKTIATEVPIWIDKEEAQGKKQQKRN